MSEERIVKSVVDLAESAAHKRDDIDQRVDELTKAVTEDPILGPERIIDPEKVGKAAKIILKGVQLTKDVIDFAVEMKKKG